MDQCDLLTESSAVRMLYIRLLEELRKKKKTSKNFCATTNASTGCSLRWVATETVVNCFQKSKSSSENQNATIAKDNDLIKELEDDWESTFNSSGS